MLKTTRLQFLYLCCLLVQTFGLVLTVHSEGTTPEIGLLELGSFTPESKIQKTYFKSNFALSWFDAWQYCRENGLFLVGVESSDEQLYIQSLLANVHGRQWWTSGTDLGHHGQFVWMSSGNPLGFSNWGNDEPEITSTHQKNCLKIWDDPNGGINTWANEYCINKYFFICEQNA